MKKRILLVVMISTILFVILASSLAVRVCAQDGWTVTLVARLGTYSSTTILGVDSGATDGFDTAYDAIAPPPPPEGVHSYFYYPSNPSGQRTLSTSIIPESLNMNWTLRVQTVGVEGTMVLNWTTIPPQYMAYIMDSTGTTILADMTQVTEYSYTAAMDVIITFKVNFVIPDLPIGPILALAVCFVSYGVFKISRRP